MKGWLKAGVMQGCPFSPTEVGTPQGGVISPLVLNGALPGREPAVVDGYSKRQAVEKPLLVRDADDCVIFHSQVEEREKVAARVRPWLEQMGVKLSPTKTRTPHTRTPEQGQVGFDFLGFPVRQLPVGKTHTGKGTKGKALGFKTRIKPSKEAIRRHTLTIKARLRKFRSASQAQLIKELNPIIWGGAAYYKTAVASAGFSRCDAVLWKHRARWARARHPDKGTPRRTHRDWRQVEQRKWVVATPTGAELRMHRKTAIQRYTKVTGTASPDDGTLL